MKRTTLSLLLLPFFMTCQSQMNAPARGEFAWQPNGLIYPDTTMQKLGHMVDSLNLRFKSCDNNRQFLSCPQGKAYTIRFASSDDTMGKLRKDMSADMDFSTLATRYKKYIVKMDTLQTVIRMKGSNNDDYYLLGTPLHGYDADYSFSDTSSEISGRWTWSYSAKDEYQKKNEIEARYLPAPLAQQNIPAIYSNYIQYVDCMIDTSARIFRGSTEASIQDVWEIVAITKLNEYLNIKMNLHRKNIKDSLYLDYEVDYISDDKCEYARMNLLADATFRKLVEDAAESCILNGTGSPALETLTAEFISKEKSLEIMRHRKVVGSCSQDLSPRLHARDIALMAAETNSWDIFLRAHLDIMNDRFERSSDGSYAYSMRKTYLKELELLNLDVVDLMIGLSLRADNTADNHYNGTIWRLGWALTESKDSSLFEQKAKQLMQDNQLDEFNRGLIFLLYRTYVYSLPGWENANRKIETMKSDVFKYPPFIESAIKDLKLRTSKEDSELL
jgi:hypothetical protein